MHVATVFPANGEHLTFLTKKKTLAQFHYFLYCLCHVRY